jgi:hypothetical protein
MSKEKKQYVMLAVLAVALVGAIYWFALRPNPELAEYQKNFAESGAANPIKTAAATTTTGGSISPSQPQPVGGTLQFESANVDVDTLLARIEEVDFNYEEERLSHDPFRPLVGPLAPARLASGEAGTEMASVPQGAGYVLRNLRVTGIMWNPNRPMAVLNDEIVHTGFVFEETGVTVETIERDRVMVRLGDALVPIELEER